MATTTISSHATSGETLGYTAKLIQSFNRHKNTFQVAKFPVPVDADDSDSSISFIDEPRGEKGLQTSVGTLWLMSVWLDP